MKTKSLYMLTDPTGADTCYIGTTNAPRRRYLEHCGNLKASPAVSSWIDSLKSRHLVPLMNILEGEIPTSEIEQAEADAIGMSKAIRGAHCLNEVRLCLPVIRMA